MKRTDTPLGPAAESGQSGRESGGPSTAGAGRRVERVVSLAPSATATLSAMGAGDAVVGVTVHCPLDRSRVGGWLNPDYDRLADLDPDLVCTADPLQADIRDELVARGYEVCHVEPDRLDAVIGSFESLGRAIGRPTAGEALAAAARDRLAAIRERVPASGSRSEGAAGSGSEGTAGRDAATPDTDADDSRPVVYCEEWGDPPMAAGNWVPEAVAAAGGRYPFRDPGERSREVSREYVERVDPDHVVIHHCGHGDAADPDLLAGRGWDLDASVHVLDDDLLNQPSPALLDGVEALAELFHTDT